MEYWLEMEEQISKGQQIIGKESLKEYSKHILDIENKIYKTKIIVYPLFFDIIPNSIKNLIIIS